MSLLVKTLLAVAGAGLFIKALIEVEKSARIELREREAGAFLDTLRQHHINEYELLHEQLVPGAKGRVNKLFEVHRVISDSNGGYFLYIHIESQKPLLQPISRERALAAQKYN
ncbi:hypothetical protein [Pseudomonas sp. SCB32]|uniref:hypothetical protein n=1 Tax=Pseudomonas sp. SCB32 TaxID=2653853 RepID=UPI0012653AEA|nr:hypothetical protein [Pseudomonas sp. SCB32]